MQAKINRYILGWACSACLALTGCQTVQTTRGGVVGVDRPQQMSVLTPSTAEVDATAAQQYQQISQWRPKRASSIAIRCRPNACGALPSG